MKLSYDLHIHSCLSPCGDDDMTPNNIINMAKILNLDVIAVSDHNTASNLPAIFKVASANNLTVIPAIEVCTSEEVHMLCYMYTLDDILDFSNRIYEYLPDIKNEPLAFGNQLLLDSNDNQIGIEHKVLVNALTIGIEKLLDIVKEYHGVSVPAHVDKNSYSIISNLGFIPVEYGFTTIEVKNPSNKINFDGRIITNSDAHYLEHIHEPVNFIEVNDKSVKSVIDYLKGK